MKQTVAYAVLGSVVLLNALLVGTLTAWPQAPRRGTLSFASNRTGNFDIYLVDATGEHLRRLTTHSADERAPTWAPGGRFLAYVSNKDGNNEIYVMDIRKKSHQRLTHHPADEGTPAWSPDGNWIAFTSDREGHRNIYKMDSTGAKLTQLTHRGENGRPAWSPDSQSLAFVSTRAGRKASLYVMTATGQGLKRLVDKKVGELEGIYQGGCAWAPNGNHIAFATSTDARMHLAVIDVNEKKRRHLTQGGPILRMFFGRFFPNPRMYSPAWSPDGDWIAYVFLEGPLLSGICDIYLINAASGEPGTRVIVGERHLSINESPAWVPETFFAVSPTTATKITRWGRLKQP